MGGAAGGWTGSTAEETRPAMIVKFIGFALIFVALVVLLKIVF